MFKKVLLQVAPNLTDNQKGVCLALISTAVILCVAIVVRLVSDRIHVFQIVFFRQLVLIALLLPAICRNAKTLRHSKNLLQHAFRVIGAFSGLCLGFLTVSNLPLAEATALSFTNILFVAVLSTVVLGEHVGWSRRLTIAIGFTGVVLVVQPSFDNLTLTYTLTGLAGAFGAAVAAICIKWISRTEPVLSLMVYQALFVGLLAFIPTLFVWQWPTMEELLLLLLIGGLASLGQWISMTAFSLGEANIVTNVQYIKIVYSMVLGYLIFSETPNSLAILGAAVILCSGIIPVVRSRMKKQRIQQAASL